MIHYHGTPIGGSRVDVARFLKGRHALVPFPNPQDMPIVADVCQSFILDNGAYTYWKRDGEMDVNAYIAWCREWSKHPAFDWALIPDIVDGTEEGNDCEVRKWPRSIRGVPVWHFHESTDRLVRLCKNWETVALGSSGLWPTPGTDGWWGRIGEALDAIVDDKGRPPCRLHGLRMLAPHIFSRLPLASADSTNVAQNSGSVTRFGMYTPPTAAQRSAVIADRIESQNAAAVWSRDPQRLLDELWFTAESIRG